MRDSSTLLHRLHLWYLDDPEAIAQVFKRSEKSHGDEHWQEITVRVMWLQVVRIAKYLEKSGCKAGDRIALYAMNSPEIVQWELGIWLMGGVSVGVHPNSTDQDLEAIVQESEPKMLLAESDLFRERLSSRIRDGLWVNTFLEANEGLLKSINEDEPSLILSAKDFLARLNSDSPQLIVYTSGTSGVPKGVILGLKQISFVADCISREWNLPFAQGTLFSFLPLSHIAEKIQAIAIALTHRYPVWFNSHYDQLIQELREVRPTMLLAVPRVWEKLREQVESKKPKLLRQLMEFDRLGAFAEKIFLSQVKEHLGLDRLTLAVSGAAKLPPAVARWFESLGITIQEIYGMSESCGLITLTHGKRDNYSTVGRPPLGIELKITPEGEVWFKGNNAFFGYEKDPEQTQAVLLEDGWVKTGDLGEWIKNSNGEDELHIIGRNREILKLSNGRMVAPIPIENALKEIAEVSNVCLVGEGHSQALALITLKDKILMEYKFIPGAIEGLSVEDETLKRKISEKVEQLFLEKKIRERIRFVLLSRDFLTDQREITQTQKLNRNQIQNNFRHFIELAYEMDF